MYLSCATVVQLLRVPSTVQVSPAPSKSTQPGNPWRKWAFEVWWLVHGSRMFNEKTSYSAPLREISQISQIILRGVNNSVSYIWLKCVWKQAFHTHYSYITLATYYIRIKQFTTVATIIHVIEGSMVVESLNILLLPSYIRFQTSAFSITLVAHHHLKAFPYFF